MSLSGSKAFWRPFSGWPAFPVHNGCQVLAEVFPPAVSLPIPPTRSAMPPTWRSVWWTAISPSCQLLEPFSAYRWLKKCEHFAFKQINSDHLSLASCKRGQTITKVLLYWSPCKCAILRHNHTCHPPTVLCRMSFLHIRRTTTMASFGLIVVSSVADFRHCPGGSDLWCSLPVWSSSLAFRIWRTNFHIIWDNRETPR